MNSKSFKLTIDTVKDQEQITKYNIRRTKTGHVLCRGRYIYIFGFRIGLHLGFKDTLPINDNGGKV